MISSTPMMMIVLLLTILISAISAGQSNLDYERVHFVDRIQGKTFTNYVFRSNVPVIQGEMVYDTWVQMLKQRAEESSMLLPDDLYVVDLSLLNPSDYQSETDFWADPNNASKGEFITWPLGVAGLYDARSYDESTQNVMSNSTVWEVDQIPQRLQTFIQMTNTPGPINPTTGKPRTVVYVIHCAAGCDRTGQFIIAYRLAKMSSYEIHTDTLQTLFKRNIDECGRCPNDWSVKATEWFCIFMRYNFRVNMGDCLRIADCKRFGNCTWPPTQSMELE